MAVAQVIGYLHPGMACVDLRFTLEYLLDLLRHSLSGHRRGGGHCIGHARDAREMTRHPAGLAALEIVVRSFRSLATALTQ